MSDLDLAESKKLRFVGNVISAPLDLFCPVG